MPDAILVLAAVTAAAVAAVLVLSPPAERRLARVGGGRPGRGESVHRSVARLARRWAPGPVRRRRAHRERAQVIRSLSALAAELTAGQPPSTALLHAGGDATCWPAAAAAARRGGDIAAALVDDADRVPALAALAACWRVGEHTGAGLAASVARLAASARAAEDVRAALEGQLAVPRATARMLAGLPLIGLAFGVLLGASPVSWLTGSAAGRLCLAAGTGLTLIGLWWTGRIAAAVERRL